MGDKGFQFCGNLQRDLWKKSEMFSREFNSSIKTDTWYHLVMVIDRKSKTIRAWVNNSEATDSMLGTTVADGMIENSHRPLVIFDAQSAARRQKCWPGPLNIDDVRIYNKALTPGEVADYHSRSANKKN